MFGCKKHLGIMAAGSCGECGEEFCEDCLVYPFGTSRPPMCVACALAFAGVRHRGRQRAPKQRLSWSERRRRKSQPTVPTVSVPTRSLETEVDIELPFGEPAMPFLVDTEEPTRLPEAPAMDSIEGMEALLAVPLPKRAVAVD
jgi:hypothetical protein